MKYQRPIRYVLEQKRHIKTVVRNGGFQKSGTFEFSTQTLGLNDLVKDLVKDLKKQSPPKLQFPIPCPDLSYLLNKTNGKNIVENLARRTEITLEQAARSLELLYQAKEEVIKTPTEENRNKLVEIASKFPNLTHPKAASLKEPKVINKEEIWAPRSALEIIHSFEKLGSITGCLRTHDTGQVASERSYYLFGQLAELEQALIRYTLDHLINKKGFNLVSVPDLLHPEIIRACGMEVQGERTQVFRLDPNLFGQVALSGTAEMAFGGLFLNKSIKFNHSKTMNKYEKAKKYCAASRCYRAESSKGKKEGGIYRVHQFTKVEMFEVLPGDIELSNLALEQVLDTQIALFEGLGLSFRVLDMPANELGNPAYRKYDIEAYLPGRSAQQTNKAVKENLSDGQNIMQSDFYGEISSCSNCTDYQARRLNIRDADMGQFCHTVNGTACAVPRMIMAICEQYQTRHGSIIIPDKLQKYMRNATEIVVKDKKKQPLFKYITSPKKLADRLKDQDVK